MGPPTILTEMSNSTYWALTRALGCRVPTYGYVGYFTRTKRPWSKGSFFDKMPNLAFFSTLLAVVLALAVPVAVPLLMVPVAGSTGTNWCIVHFGD